jgi:hypothetical protein
MDCVETCRVRLSVCLRYITLGPVGYGVNPRARLLEAGGGGRKSRGLLGRNRNLVMKQEWEALMRRY